MDSLHLLLANAMVLPTINPALQLQSLPKARDAIKIIGERFEVNANMGSATVSVPIPLSTARDQTPSCHSRIALVMEELPIKLTTRK